MLIDLELYEESVRFLKKSLQYSIKFRNDELQMSTYEKLSKFLHFNPRCGLLLPGRDRHRKKIRGKVQPGHLRAEGVPHLSVVSPRHRDLQSEEQAQIQRKFPEIYPESGAGAAANAERNNLRDRGQLGAG